MSISSKNDGNRLRKILIGYVSSVHGVKGEIKIQPLTDYPERFRSMDFLNLFSADGTFVGFLPIKCIREHKGEWIVESGLPDRNEAEKLVGLSIFIDPEERVSLPEDTFWVDDLIGLVMEDIQGNYLGTVSNLISGSANEIYEVKDIEGKLHYIPAVSEFIKNIDLVSGKIVVQLIEGLWE